MSILGLDTSTKKASVTILNSDNLISKSIDNEITHSEKLLPLIDECLKDANLNISEIDIFACTIGPGSFTGIRIGIATLKAFAKVNNAEIFALSSLDVLAYSILNSNDNDSYPDYIVSMIDAKNSRVYYRVYKLDVLKHFSEKIPVLKPLEGCNNMVITDALEEIGILLSKEENGVSSSVAFVYDSPIHEETISDKFNLVFKEISLSQSTISTDTLISMYKGYAKLGYEKDYMQNYLTLDALYARPSQAERTKNGEK